MSRILDLLAIIAMLALSIIAAGDLDRATQTEEDHVS
jgi:hypothetical protein